VSAQTRQMLLSLLVALAIVAIAIAVVTAKFGPTSAAELEAREDRLRAREELQEERLEQREELREEREER
jgi:type II secretory pathway pseudopilin PulG